jgi:hypothetical protein
MAGRAATRNGEAGRFERHSPGALTITSRQVSSAAFSDEFAQCGKRRRMRYIGAPT